MSVVCPVCGKETTIKEVKLDDDKITKDVKEERTPMDYAVRNYSRVNDSVLKKVERIVGKEYVEMIMKNFDALKELAYEYQNKTLRVKFDDGHTYVIHVYYVLEVFRYVSLSPAIIDFVTNKRVKGENDDAKEMIALLIAMANPLYSLLYILNQKSRKGKGDAK